MRAVDLGVGEQVRAAEGSFDLMIHCASTRGGTVDDYRRVYLDGARHLGERFKGTRFLFVSSSSVYAQRDGQWVTEESEARPEHETGRILRAAENLVLAREGTVIRLAGLYGPERSALLRRALHGEALVDPENDRFVNQLHRDDAAAALFLLGQRSDEVKGEIYQAADDTPLPLSECYRWLAEKLGRPQTTAAAATRKRGESNKRVSNAKLRRMGWAPLFPSFIEGMERSVLPAMGDVSDWR